jgi:hypothetical protein
VLCYLTFRCAKWRCVVRRAVFFLRCLTFEDVTKRLSQNVGKPLPTYAEQHPRRAKTIVTTFLRNVGRYTPRNAASHSKRRKTNTAFSHLPGFEVFNQHTASERDMKCCKQLVIRPDKMTSVCNNSIKFRDPFYLTNNPFINVLRIMLKKQGS